MLARLADRLKEVKPSTTLAITSKAKKLKSEGRDIVNLSAGEPDFDTPDFIKEAAIKSIGSGFTKYTPTTGTPELKKLISEKFKAQNNLEYAPNQIIVSCGAKHSIFNTCLALINPGDEVIIPLPYWVSYPEMVSLCGGKSCFVKTTPSNNFKITAADLEISITSKTKLLILNSPSNPCGCVYSCDELKVIADICVKKNILVISDEIYEKIIFDGLKHASIASFNKDIYNLCVTVNGLSKSYSMTGWRLGYLGAPLDIAEAISKIQDHSTSNPTSFAQKGAEAALQGPSDFIDNLCRQFQERRDFIVSRLKKMHNISPVVPQGAFYIFCDISKTKLDSVTVANRLLEEANISVIPGDGFGMNDYIRISFANSKEQISKGMDRLQDWLSKL
jgi:aspartate aminotransferase